MIDMSMHKLSEIIIYERRKKLNHSKSIFWDWTQNCTATVREVLSKYIADYKVIIPCGPEDYSQETTDIPFQSSNIYKT